MGVGCSGEDAGGGDGGRNESLGEGDIGGFLGWFFVFGDGGGMGFWVGRHLVIIWRMIGGNEEVEEDGRSRT